MKKVENLKKITLFFEAGTSSDAMDFLPRFPGFEFIFGLAPEGMTPFEYELLDRTEGEEVLLHLEKEAFHTFFERIHPPLMDLFDGRNDVYLKVNIVAISSADPREIIKSMAEMTAYGGSGCDCGCGCGDSSISYPGN
jgi:hypothetical protein